MRTYEAVFVLDERRHDDGGRAFAESVAAYIKELGGKVIEQASLGRRQFARPVRKQNSGIYLDFIIELESGQVAAFKEKYRLNETVFRLAVFAGEELLAARKRKPVTLPPLL